MDDMPAPSFWVSISVKGDEHFVHVRERGARETIGPFSSHHAAAARAKEEWRRLTPSATA